MMNRSRGLWEGPGWRCALFASAALWGWLFGARAPAGAQYVEEYAPAAGLSRSMQMAIRFYDQGRDSEAMDRFMEVLSNGDPSERTMANEYLNLITQRMYSGSSIQPKPGTPPPSPATLVDPVPRPAAPGRLKAPPPEADTRPAWDQSGRPNRGWERGLPGRTEAEAPRASKAVMKKEIDAKIKAMARSYLAELESFPDIRVLMADRQNPRALGLPADLLFDTGIVFKKSAGRILTALGGLAFCLGATQVAILPEGAVIGDAKILDMRRTMGISAHLFQAGIAPPRVRVNLMNSQVDVPKGMLDFRGIVVLFVYNQPLTLSVDGMIGEDAGPPISLGVWPGKFRADRGEGSIIEFSIVEPPAGLMTWKFQLKQPEGGAGSDLVPLQEVIGGSPVFHQIYWNGRRNYFGPELAPGRYEVVLSATDGRNRTRKLHQWITLDGPAATPAAPAAAAAAPAPVAPPPAELKPDAPVRYVQLKKLPKGDARGPRGKALKRKGKAKPARKGARAKAPVPDASEKPAPPPEGRQASPAEGQQAPPPSENPPPAQPSDGAQRPAGGAMNYKITFSKGTQQMSQEGDRTIRQVVEVLQYYPRENLNLVGYASQSEPDAQELSRKRANAVSTLLVNRFGVDPKRIQIQSKVVPEETYEVQIFTVTARE